MNKLYKRKLDLYKVPCETCMYRTFKKRKYYKSIKPFFWYCNCPDFNRKEFLYSDNYLPNIGEFNI